MIALPAFLAFRRARAEGEPEALPPDAMTPVHERYGQLKSYSDTGKLTTRYQWPGTSETDSHYRFETAFRAPRNFFFRFDTEADSGDDTFVIWCDGGDFQSWWKATGVHEVYSGGRGADGFYAGGSPTRESVNLLGPHVFSQALLYGPTSRLIDLREAGEEDVAGHACSKFIAAGRQTGVVTNEARPVTIWVDKEVTLVRKVQIDAESGSQKDLVDTILYEIEPTADPDLPDERFQFTPPA
jgi:outer membrane lipoprotein-sorting protein